MHTAPIWTLWRADAQSTTLPQQRRLGDAAVTRKGNTTKLESAAGSSEESPLQCYFSHDFLVIVMVIVIHFLSF